MAAKYEIRVDGVWFEISANRYVSACEDLNGGRALDFVEHYNQDEYVFHVPVQASVVLRRTSSFGSLS